MSILINPGSEPVSDQGDGWTNTYEGAVVEAERWHRRMVDDGFGQDVDLLVQDDPIVCDGRWVFLYRHRVTGAVVELHTHGIDNMDAYTKRHIFGARVYWNGSSTGNPELSDWAAPRFVQTFRPDGVS